MKPEAQIVWETKSDMYNRLWDIACENEISPLQAAALMFKELRKIKGELEAEVKE